jgi:hypothetical protein
MRTIAHGPKAFELAAKMAATVNPVIGNGYRIEPGTVDGKNVIVGQEYGEVHYIYLGEQTPVLRSVGLGAFLHNYFVGEVTKEIYRRTRWIIPASKIVMAFSMGLVVGFVGIAATAVNVAVLGAAAIAVFANAHAKEVALARQHWSTVYDTLRWYRTHCPVLYRKLPAVMGRGLREALASAPSGVTAEDVAAVIGRLLGGMTGAVETGLASFLKILTKTIAIYGSLHLPAMMAKGAMQDPKPVADAMVQELRTQRVLVSDTEAHAIQLELARAPQALPKLKEMQVAVEQLTSALDKLMTNWANQ